MPRDPISAVETPAGEAIGAELAYPLLATFLLTGGRRAEVLGLELEDVSLDRRTITFRPNALAAPQNPDILAGGADVPAARGDPAAVSSARASIAAASCSSRRS